MTLVHAPVSTFTVPSARTAKPNESKLTPDHGATRCAGHDPWSHVAPERAAELKRDLEAWYADFCAREL